MTETSRPVSIPKLHVQLGRYLPLLLLLGLAVNLILPQITTLERSLQVIREILRFRLTPHCFSRFTPNLPTRNGEQLAK